MSDLSAATQKKRDGFLFAVEQLLAPEPCVKGVVGVGSIAMNTARAGSDIDALVFMHPLDEYIVPAESIWCPWDDTFYSIFTEDKRVQDEGIQLDFKLCDLAVWNHDLSVWSEPQRAGLAEGWIAFDRDGSVARLIAERAAYDALIDMLFAVNRRWRFWRDRELTYVLRLPWLPHDFEQRLLIAQNAPSLDRDGYTARATRLLGLFEEVVARLQAEGFYSDDPIGEAFVRSQTGQPGRTWNMAEWNVKRKSRRQSR